MASKRMRLGGAAALAVMSLAVAAQVATTIDARQLLRDVEILAADDMEGRRIGTRGSARARAYIVERFRAAGIQPLGGQYEHRFDLSSDPARGTGVNVLGVIRGRVSPDRYMVVTAHYDHLGVADGQVYNGAGDNATGVATLLAIAAHFHRSPPDHSLLLAALDGEEIGLLGARAFLTSGIVPIAAIVLNVNIDMIGRDAKNVLYAAGTYHYPFLERYLSGVAPAPVRLRLGHDRPDRDEQDWTRGSDHYEFHKLGIPFVYFGVEDFEQHHRPTDDAGTIHKEFFLAAATTVLAAVDRLDANLENIRHRR